MHVGELAQRSRLSTSTVRYYEKLGLLPRVSRTRSGYRDYPADALNQLALIRRAKELGFSLREIRSLLTKPRGASREAVLVAVGAKLTELERERGALRTTERQLRGLRTRMLRDGKQVRDLREWLLLRDREGDAMTFSRGSLGHFDEDAFRILNLAAHEARKFRHGWLGTEHLLLAFAQLSDEGMREIFGGGAYELPALRKGVEKVVGVGSDTDEGVAITHRVERIMGIAEGFALSDDRHATAADLLLAMLEDDGGVGVGLMRERGADPRKIAAALREKLS